MTDTQPTIYVDNVKCRLAGVDKNTANLLSKAFALKVPNFWYSPKYKAGMWDGTYKFFVRPSNSFPTGLLPKVLDLLAEDYEIVPQIIDQRKDVNKYQLSQLSENYKISDVKTARDYQVDTLNKLITNNINGISFTRGVVNIATNGGKTSIAIALIKELYPKLVESNANFLFVTHSKEIAVQAKKSIETDLGIEVGFIGDGKWDLKPVTVTIVTTLFRRMNKPEFKKLIDSVIGFVADECHHATSNSWYEVFNSFTNAQIRVGLTGTVDKANPINEMKLYSCTSEVINRISNEYLIENGYSAKPICVLFNVSEPNLDDEPYQVAYQLGIVDNDYRSDLIARICKKETDANNVVLILVEHIEHGEIISERLKSLNKRVFFTNGQLDSETRQQLLDDLKNGNIDILISTAILDEGVDVSGINAIIYARGGKSTRKLLQGIGRGLRKKEDGSKLRFYDFIDDTSAHLLKHSLHRYETLEAENFTIKNFSIEDFEKMTLKEIENGTF